MPELRSGARISKRLGDLHPTPQCGSQDEKLVAPAQARTRRRGRGRGNAADIAKGPSTATPARPTAAGRGRGARLIALEPKPPGVVIPQTVGLKAPELAFNRTEDVPDKKIAMNGGSADKIMGVEEEASVTRVPDRAMRTRYVTTLMSTCLTDVVSLRLEEKQSCAIIVDDNNLLVGQLTLSDIQQFIELSLANNRKPQECPKRENLLTEEEKLFLPIEEEVEDLM